MTELMKENKLAKSIDDMCNAFEESQQEVGRLERENARMKAMNNHLVTNGDWEDV